MPRHTPTVSALLTIAAMILFSGAPIFVAAMCFITAALYLRYLKKYGGKINLLTVSIWTLIGILRIL